MRGLKVFSKINSFGIFKKGNVPFTQRSNGDEQALYHFRSESQGEFQSNNIFSKRALTTYRRKGTLNGVFLPCIQSILNIILFLRLPSITAQAGTIQTTLIILACASSTLMTAISLSAIATNGDIMKGGPYYVISRTLGLEVGGALGLLYYLGNTMACSMCVLGGVEAFLLSIRGDKPSLLDTTGGALGGSYETLDEEIIGDGLARSLLQNDYVLEEGNIEQFVEMAEDAHASAMKGPLIDTGGNIRYDFGLGVMDLDANLDTQNLSLLLVFLLAVYVRTGFHRQSSNIFLGLMMGCIFSACLGCVLFATGEYTGALDSSDKNLFDNIYPRYQEDLDTKKTATFMSLFALFYPSVTGILSGSINSECLKDPANSIPKGTIWAIIFTTVIYIGVSWLFGTTMANQTLKTRKFVFAAVAYPTPMVVKVGVLISVIGAALGYMSSATEILSAMALDDSMPILSFIRKGSFALWKETRNEKRVAQIGEEKVNRRALVFTWFLVSLPTLTGNLDHISPLMTMCYLLMYAGINCSCFLLGVIDSPGFRPTFRYFHWSVSALGFIWCLCLALVIDAAMACLALALFLALLTYNNKMVEKRRDWGDVFDSVKYNVLTGALTSLSNSTTHDLNAKNWRPQLLTFVDMDSKGMPTNLYLLSLARQLKKAKGINIVVGILLRDFLCGDPYQHTTLEGHQGMDNEIMAGIVSKSKDALQEYMAQEKLAGFAEVSVTTRQGMCDALWSAVLHSGLGPLSPNTILLSFPTREKRTGSDIYWSEKDFLTAIIGIRNMKVALMIFRGSETYPTSKNSVSPSIIDVWWIIHDGGLLLLLPYILSKNAVWGRGGATLRIFAVKTSYTDNPKKIKEAVIEHLKRVRIQASVIVVDLSSTSIASDIRGSQFAISNGFHDQENVSSLQAKTLGEVFTGVSNEIPYASLSKNAEAIDIESGHDKGDSKVRQSTVDHRGIHEIHKTRERINNAKAFNRSLRLHSSCSSLVVTNLPDAIKSEYSSHFFDYIDTMCEGCENVLLIRGSGKEIITTYA